MINTIFYFPESLTFNEYINKLDKDADDGISKRTIVFAEEQGRIYKNGQIYGTNTYDVQNLIELNRYNDEYVRAAIEQLEHDLQDESDAIDLQGLQYLALAGRVKTVEDHGYVNEAEILTAVAGEIDGSTQKSSIRNKINNVAKTASAALFAEVSDSNDYITAQSIVNAITTNTAARANLASSFTAGDNQMWAAAFTQADLINSSSALYAALRDKANDNEVVKKASVIASINSSGESNVSISADKINLNGNVIAQRLIAASAAIGGFTIGSSKLSNSGVEFNGDGSGYLAGGNLQWNSSGELDMKSANLHINTSMPSLWFPEFNVKGRGAILVGEDSYNLEWNTSGGGVTSSDVSIQNLAQGLGGSILLAGAEREITFFNPYVHNSEFQNGLALGTTDGYPIASIYHGPTSVSHRWDDPDYFKGLNLSCNYGGIILSASTVLVNSDLWAEDEIHAKSFIKDGGTSSQVLMADGSTKALSEFTTNGDGVYFPLTGGSLNGHLINKGHSVLTGSLHITNPSGTIDTLLRTTIETSEDASYFSITDMSDVTNHYYTIGNLTGHDQLTVEGTLLCTGPATATSFIKTNGTSSLFLKADGSVDGTSYLPLTGGTMTGILAIDGSLMNGAYVLDVDGVARVRDNMTVGGIFTVSDSSYGYSDISVDSTGLCITTSQMTGTNQLHLYGAATITSSCTADSFVKSGGTSSEVLMANGSVTNLVNYLDLSSNESVYEGSGGDWSTNTFTLPAGRWNYSFYLKGQLDVWAGDGTNLISVLNMSTNQTITSTYDFDNTDTYSSASRYTIPFVLSAPTKVRISISDGNGAILYIYKPMISHGEYAPKI